MSEKFYVTTAIAYASRKPHFGNTCEVIMTDALARYQHARGKDVLRMFLCESSVIALICAVLASIATRFGCDLVNSYIMEQMNIAIPFALFGVRQVLFVFALAVLTAVIASVVPIVRIVKTKPVDLIRRS